MAGIVSRSRIGRGSPTRRQLTLKTASRQRMLTVMSETTDLLGAGTSQDPAVGLRAVAALRRLVEQLEALQVHAAREQRWSWAEIAAALDVSKQAVHKKHAGRAPLTKES